MEKVSIFKYGKQNDLLIFKEFKKDCEYYIETGTAFGGSCALLFRSSPQQGPRHTHR